MKNIQPFINCALGIFVLWPMALLSEATHAIKVKFQKEPKPTLAV